MKLYKYLNEDIDKTFIRLGSMSGQKQKHKGNKQAPARKGIWLLPIQAGIYDLCFLGGYNKKTNRLFVKPEQYKKVFGITYNEFCELPLDQMDKLEKKHMKKKLKEYYKKVKLKNTNLVWAHIGKGAPNKIIGDWPWYQITVAEYWQNFKRVFGKTLKNTPYNIDGEWAEIFWETT